MQTAEQSKPVSDGKSTDSSVLPLSKCVWVSGEGVYTPHYRPPLSVSAFSLHRIRNALPYKKESVLGMDERDDGEGGGGEMQMRTRNESVTIVSEVSGSDSTDFNGS